MKRKVNKFSTLTRLVPWTLLGMRTFDFEASSHISFKSVVFFFGPRTIFLKKYSMDHFCYADTSSISRNWFAHTVG